MGSVKHPHVELCSGFPMTSQPLRPAASPWGLVECKHCKQTMQWLGHNFHHLSIRWTSHSSSEPPCRGRVPPPNVFRLGSLRLHFKGCAARPIVPPKNVKGGSGFLRLGNRGIVTPKSHFGPSSTSLGHLNSLLMVNTHIVICFPQKISILSRVFVVSGRCIAYNRMLSICRGSCMISSGGSWGNFHRHLSRPKVSHALSRDLHPFFGLFHGENWWATMGAFQDLIQMGRSDFRAL